MGEQKTALVLSLILCFAFVSILEIDIVEAEPKMIVVPDDFSKLFDAVGNASEGDTIFVKKGTYEIKSPDINNTLLLFGLEINKTLSIIGEDPEKTIIAFPPDTRYGFPLLFSNKRGFNVTADNFEISNLTITNCDYGVIVRGNRAQVSNIITSSMVIYGNYCNIFKNSLNGPNWYPVYINGSFNNYMQNKEFSIRCDGSYNYWDSYSGYDRNGDGIGDTPYITINDSQDEYPLMGPITSFDAGTWEWIPFNVDVVSNSTVSDFSFNPESALIRFNVDGKRGTNGFCRVTIPKDLLDADESNWTVIIEGNPVTPKINEDTNSIHLYFTYNHNMKIVEIIGTKAIPEFPSWIIIPLFLIATLVVIVYRNRLRRKVVS